MVFDRAAHHVPDMENQAISRTSAASLPMAREQDDEFDRAADLADRILRGAKPGDLPLELPTRYHFTVNLKAARDRGPEIPRTNLWNVWTT